jgi:hypothetical protein
MVKIIIIEKNGAIQETDLKSYDDNQIYKKAGLKSMNGFELQTEWGAEIDGKLYSVSVFGKATGRAGHENKYEFPPPIDNVLLFGSCVLVNKVNGKAADLTKEEWLKIYEHLYGGFEDLGDEDSEYSEEELDDDIPRTKEGYVKDDFIVDDDDDEDDFDSDDQETEESEEEIVVKKKKTTAIKKTPVKSTKKTKNSETIFQVEQESNYLNCEDELVEENYV